MSTKNVLATVIYTKVSVVPFSPTVKKTTTFSLEDLRKTLSQYVMSYSMAA